jgi:NADH-quinone oxidoreductase subunit G
VQRLRPAIGHQGETRFGWRVLDDLGKRLGVELGVLTAGIAFKQLTEAVPFYAGLTLDELGGQGVRWVEREQASTWPAAEAPDLRAPQPDGQPGGLRWDGFRSLWAAPEVLVSPALAFLHPGQRAELSAEDARRLGLSDGDRERLATNGTRVDAVVRVRGAVPPGTVFVEEPGANALTGPTLQVEKA